MASTAELLIAIKARNDAGAVFKQMERDFKALNAAAGVPRVDDLSRSFATMKEALIDPGKLASITNETKRLQLEIAKGGNTAHMAALRGEVDSLEHSFLRLTGTAKTSGVGGALKSALGFAGVGAGVFGAAEGIRITQDAVKNASALNETINKSNVVFGPGAAQVEAFGNRAAKSLGMSKQQAMEATATFGALFEASGLGRGKAQEYSTGLVKLAADLASFNNTDPAQALEALRAGMVGEVEPLRRYGVNLLETNVAVKAHAMGLREVNGVLSDQDKMAARYALILQQTATAQGDFARTSDQLANSQRILNAQMGDLSARMGGALLPLETMGVHAMTKVMDTLDNVGRKMTETRVVASAGLVGSGELVSEQAAADAQVKAQSIENALVTAANNSSRAWRDMERDFSTSMSNMLISSIAASDAMEAHRGFVFGGQEADRKQAEKDKLMASAAASDLADVGNRVQSVSALQQQGAAIIADYTKKQAEAATAAKKAITDAAQAITEGINRAKQALTDFAQAPLLGETAMGDKMFGLDVAIAQKERDLLSLQGQRGAGRQITTLTKDLADLRKQKDILSKEQFLQFAPEHRFLGRLANPQTEMSVEDAQAGILSQWQTLGILATQSKEPVTVGDVHISMSGVTGDNLVDKARTAGEELLEVIRNARNSNTRYQGAASPQLSGGG